MAVAAGGVGAFLAVVAGSSAGTQVLEYTAVLGVVGAITWLQVTLLRRRSGLVVPLPAVIVGALNLVGVAGFLFYREIQAVAAVSASMPTSDSIYAGAASIFTVASLAVFAGGIVLRPVTPDENPAPLGAAAAVAKVRSVVLILAALLPAAMLVAAYGPSGLVSRSVYLSTVGAQTYTSLGSATAPAAVGLLAFILFDARRGRARLLAFTLLLGYVLLLFAIGTRALALIPILLLFAYLQQRAPDGTRRKLRLPAALAVVAVTPMLLQLPLAVRSNRGAGLIPFAEQLAGDPGLLVRFDLAAAFGNVLFAVPLAGHLGTSGLLLPEGSLGISLNPLPGSMTDWGRIGPLLRLNQYTPFSGIGELALHGWAALVGVLFTAALALSAMQRLAEKAPGAGRVLLQVAGIGLAALFVLDLLQYNLRAGVRVFYYYAALVAVVRVGAKLSQRRTLRDSWASPLLRLGDAQRGGPLGGRARRSSGASDRR
ncbi:hypothetical protein GCM10009609_40200 [Pseudonocardia aurantiaca]|uniref:O-antigen polysaccharide polymerase Wzy n=1 Tax=Pseudonocardia aurantiaca TaxID=75290 RepID=A0ABW4FQT6_9PSEU